LFKSTVLGIAVATVFATASLAQTFSIGSNPQGSLAYSAAAGIAKVANDVAKIKARVVPQGGPVVTLPLVSNGELDFSISISMLAVLAHKGVAMFKRSGKQPNAQVVAAVIPLELGWFVRKDSDIMSMSDLRGKRVSSKLSKQKAVLVTGRAKLATAGLTYKDLVGVPAPNGVRQVQDFMAGKIDAVSFSLSAGITAQANAKVGIRVLSLPNSPEAEKAMQKLAPGSRIETRNPGPKYPGILKPTNIFVAPFLLMASSKTPADVVYRLTRALYENKQKLVASHKAFGGMEPRKMHANIGVPYHAGALRFYKEKGM
jgi:TRAP transporter TAXI family solute receptor